MSRSVRLLLALALVLVFALGAGAWWRSPGQRVARGRRALDQHDLAVAEAQFRAAVAADPEARGALEGLGWTYLLAGQQGPAEAAFQRCVELEARDVDCLRGLGAVQMARGDLVKARARLEQALGVEPDHPKALASLALLELSEGRVEAASARYESLAARFPEEAEYRVGQGETRLRQGRLEEALAAVDEGLAIRGMPRRTRGLLLLLRARVLVATVVGRLDPERCAELVGPLTAWLDAAEAAVAEAKATGVALPTAGEVGRLVRRARGNLEDACPPRVPSIQMGDGDGK